MRESGGSYEGKQRGYTEGTNSEAGKVNSRVWPEVRYQYYYLKERNIEGKTQEQTNKGRRLNTYIDYNTNRNECGTRLLTIAIHAFPNPVDYMKSVKFT